MNIQSALESKAPGGEDKISFARALPFVVFLANFILYLIVVVSMAFNRTTWDKWEPVLMFSVLTLGPSVIPLIVDSVVQGRNGRD